MLQNKLLNETFLRKSFQEIQPVQKLGQGSFASVVLIKEDIYRYALKIINKREVEKKKHLRFVIEEIRILSSIDHFFINKLKFYGEDSKKIYIGLEYIDGGDLFNYMQLKKSLRENDCRFLISQIVIALNFIHSKKILYRDLKPENILVNSCSCLKLTDFGLAREIKESRAYTFCGSPEYMAPEIVLHKGYHFPVDWWAVGILLFELIYGETPFVSETICDVCTRISEGEFNFPKKPAITRECEILIRGLLEYNPVYRMGSAKSGSKEIESSVWFKDFDWDKVNNGNFTNYLQIKPVKIKKENVEI